MTTLRDIAEHMGLSESTISRILNGKGRVSDETRAKVLKYARSVGYRPNVLAVSLKQQRTNTVGVSLPDIHNAFYSSLFKEIDHGLRAEGLTPILFNTNEDVSREEEFVDYLHTRMVDAMIVATSGSGVYRTLPRELLDRITFIDNRPDVEGRVRFIGSENRAAAYALTEHLIERGHFAIATMSGNVAESSAEERLLGLQECLAAHGLPLRPEWVIATNFLYEDGLRQAEVLFAADPRPDAVVAQNNVLAYAVLRVARARGIRVPDDLAVVCFDHIDTYGFMRPVITSMVQPVAELASLAVRGVLDSIRGTESGPLEVLVPVEFHSGETS